MHKTIILPVDLHGCETWSLTLSEEHRKGVFENRVLRRIFGPKRVEITGEWRKLHNGELHNLNSWPDITSQIKSKRMLGQGMRQAYRVFVGKQEGKRPLERPMRRWNIGIRMDLREIGWGGMCGVDSPWSE
jgi:hypothetical protein